MSALGSALADYLELRRSLGYKLEGAEAILGRFVAHLDAVGAETVTVAAALAWSTATPGGDRRLQAIRGFARYLQALDPAHEVPPTRLVPATTRRALAHLYSDEEVAALMSAARGLEPPLRAATTETVIGVLAVTGMRIGEVLGLEMGDVDWDQGMLVVRVAKFDKTRHVPVSPSTLAALADYRRLRRRLAPAPSTLALFVGGHGRRLSYAAFSTAFGRVLEASGVSAGGRRPRIHHFRHSFAVRTLEDWYRSGADVHALLPRLSTYLGHVDPAATYWYLKLSPELLALAAQRVERGGGGRP